MYNNYSWGYYKYTIILTTIFPINNSDKVSSNSGKFKYHKRTSKYKIY